VSDQKMIQSDTVVTKESLVLNQTQGFGVSERYSTITTQNVLDRLTASGYTINSTALTKPRSASKQGFQKHMVRLSHSDLTLKNIGDSRPEVVIVNSHDGSTSIKFLIGIFRMVCSNGLIVGQTFGGVSIRHVGDVWTKIDKGLDDIRDRLPLIGESIERFQSVKLTESQVFEYTREAVKLIVPENSVNVNLSSALRVRRSEDSQSDLWTVFNRLQESALRGGVKYQTETKDVNGLVTIKNNTSRTIKSIDRQVEVNKGLWDLTEAFSKAA
jgi:hypothetical protein